MDMSLRQKSLNAGLTNLFGSSRDSVSVVDDSIGRA